MKIDFINIGPGRTGTSWLYQLLQSHPDISLPVVKETEFFNHNWHLGSDWYEGLFSAATGKGIIRGEISNMYYCDMQALDRIKLYNPNMKIVVNYRDPHDLLVSYLTFGLRRGLEIPRGNYIKTYPIGMLMGSGYTDRLFAGRPSEGDMVSTFDSVLLSRYISKVYEVFDKRNVFIFNYDSLVRDADVVSRSLFDFLGVNHYSSDVLHKSSVNSAAEPRLKFLGKVASRLAFFLRKHGLFSILTYLHNNALVKKLVLRPAVKGTVFVEEAMREQLAAEAVRTKSIMDSYNRDQ